MEAGESGTRQSGNTSANNFDYPDHRPREAIDRSYREGPAMATAALISPSAPYHSHHSSYSSGYPHSAPPTSIPGMISPVESRRTSDDLDAPHRQSLPSIQEVISGTKPVSSYPQPAQAPLPPPPQQQQSLPSPFASHPPSRPFDLGADKNPSPRTLHPVTSTYARQEQLPAFSDPARPSLSNRPAPPLNTYPGQHPSPPVKLEHLEPDHRHVEAHPLSGGYPHAPLPNQAPPALYSQTGRLPPGQLPLSSYPASPQHGAPTLPSPFEQQRTPIYGDEGDFGNGRGNEYKATLDRAFEVFNYGDALHMIASTSRTLFNFAEAYDAAAREQQGPQPIPSRLPSESEVSVLLTNVILMKKKLEEVREMVQQNRINSERVREAGGPRKHYEDDDVSMYGGESLKQPYSMSEVKKRRGRAAPPGRCHSCNRIDTPEWRRGPDGARTLCNACGLHYAKLERKRQLENRSIRPKPADN